MSAFAFSRSFSNELLRLLSGMILFIRYKKNVTWRGCRWDFRFWPFFRSVFRFLHRKLRFLGFVGRCGFRFFGFLATGFLAKIKQVRFLCGSLFSPDVRLFFVSILLSFQVKLQCGILEFWLRFTVVCARLSVSVDERKKQNEKRKKHESSENVPFYPLPMIYIVQKLVRQVKDTFPSFI